MAEEICIYCGVGRHAAEACPRVSAIEYGIHPETGVKSINRIEFHRPESPEAELTKAFFGDPDKRADESRRRRKRVFGDFWP